MEIAGVVVTAIVIIVMIALCSYCCKRHRGKVLGPPQQTGLTITTATTMVPQPPYPTVPHHPVPQTMPPPSGIGFQPVSQTHYPYPVGQAPGYYYPPPQMGPVMSQPYPSQPSQSAMAPPPPYHEAVGQPTAQPPIHESYAKQAPYNPNYQH